MKLPKIRSKKQPIIAYHNQQYLRSFCFILSETSEATDSWAEVVDGEEQAHEGRCEDSFMVLNGNQVSKKYLHVYFVSHV